MFTAKKVRSYVDSLGEKQIFTSRDLLFCGRRNAIDLALFKLVRKKVIIRLARGVFTIVSEKQYLPSALKIAKAKASAFGRKITEHGSNAAAKFDFPFIKTETPNVFLYYSSGSTSSFVCIHGKVQFQSVCARKLKLSRSNVGSLLKSIWHLGFNRRTITKTKARYHEGQLGRHGRLAFREEIKKMPSWIYNSFYPNQTRDKFPTWNQTILNLESNNTKLVTKQNLSCKQVVSDFLSSQYPQALPTSKPLFMPLLA